MVTDPVKATIPDDVFVGGGEMGTLMRSLDWSQTLLGSLSGWAQSLKTAVSILLNSRYPMFIWWGSDYANLYNDAYRPILGTNKHPQFLGHSAKDCWTEIWDVVGSLAKSVRQTGEPTWSEDLLLLVDRYGYLEEAYFTFSYSPVRDESGGVGGVFCACIETTEKIVGERRLRTLRELAAKTTEAKTVEEACHIATNTLASNPQDIPFALLYILEDNGKQARLVGTTGIEIGTVTSPKQVDLTQKIDAWNLSQVNTTGKAELVDDLIARFDPMLAETREESPRTALVMPIEQSGQKQHLAGLLVLGISPRRKFDDEYQGFFDLIAGNVATAITNTRAYEEERKRAEALAELDRAKTVFFSNVSHELRTPLTLMLSPLEEMLSVPDDTPFATQRQQVEMVQRNALRLLKLVNTLLDFARIEAGRIQAVYEATDVAAFTAELASVFRSATEHAGLCLTVDCPPLPEPIYVDRKMWENIVLNLLSNAFKFTFEGTIIVSLRWVEKQVELALQDTGIGIPADEIPKLFERFHQVQGVQGRTVEGSGIGLSLVQELVHLHGGTVKVTSTLGQGSCFTVSIPTGYAHLPQDRVSPTWTPVSIASGTSAYVEEALRWLPEEAGEQVEIGEMDGSLSPSSPPLLKVARILLVEDNSDMRDYVKRLLIRHYDVQVVPDGMAALAAIRQHVPDLVLTDVMMPRLDGFGLLRELRANPHTREIPIILLSARVGEESRVEGLETGADDYLIKPFSARELLARVEVNLKMARLRRETLQREQMLRGEAQTARDQTRNILESVTEAFVAFDRQWRYTYVNRAAVLLLQRSPEELIGKNVWEEVFPSEVGGLAYRELHRAVAQQTAVSWEEFGQPVQRWLEINAYPSANEIAVYFRDITERKQAEAERERLLHELETERTRLEAVLRQMPAAVMIADAASDKLVLANEQVDHIVGYSFQLELQMEEYEQLVEFSGFRPDGRRYAPDEWPLMRSLRTGEVVTGEEIELERGDGSRIFIDANSAPILDSQGQVVAAVVVFQDITERKRAEKEREELLSREQAARAEAEAANRIKDEFLAVLSHELRSPLNPILGWTRLLRSGKLDQTKTTHALEVIERNAKLQTQLIEDLLDVSRILSGKLRLEKTPVNLGSTIEAAIETVRLAAQAKSIQIQTVFDPNIGLVLGDAARLQQVVWNLLSNAVKFTASDGRVEVRLECIDSYAQIQVSDTGKGIHPDFLPYVFEYFRQADATTTRKFGGLGLGLAIVRHLVELHGGTVLAESRGEGQGATFTVRLSLLKNKDTSIKDEDNSSVPKPDPSPLTGIRVLVVDDDPDTRELISFILEDRGAIVTSAVCALEALQIIVQTKLDVLISDIGMPDMDGYTLMRQIRATPNHNSQILAIALTAYAGQINQKQALAVGFKHHITKPVDAEQLVQVITKMGCWG